MKRDTSKLSTTEFDLVIIGGGIFGSCAVWEAALRGIKVALLEKNDFSHATSANHFKIAHCGIRYLQHADIFRLRESSRERSALIRIAPHLVHTVPIVIPTYGNKTKGKIFLGIGMSLYDLLTSDRNKGIISDNKIKNTKYLNKKEILSLFPNIPQEGLTGGVVFEEGQMYNPPRLALSFVKSATERGADVANYIEATGIIRKGSQVSGVKVKDLISGDIFDIKCKMVLNTAGPWANHLLREGAGISIAPPPTFSRDLAFVIPRYFDNPYGLALTTHTKDADSIIDRGGRHLFTMPWRDYTLIGVWHKVFHQRSEKLYVTDEELHNYSKEVNGAYPGICENINKIKVVNMGLTLFGDEDDQKSQKISFGKRSQIIDHEKIDHVKGLITLIGVRATTARGMASKALDLICKKMQLKAEKIDSRFIPIWGGDFKGKKEVIKNIKNDIGFDATENTIQALYKNYGSGYKKVLNYQVPHLGDNNMISETTVLKAEILHAVHDEMALKLKDVIFRRTDMGTGSPVEGAALHLCADLMAKALNWNQEKKLSEINQVKESYPRLG